MASQRLWPTISAANLDIFTLSAWFANACDIAQLVVRIAETIEDAFRTRGSALGVFDVYVQSLCAWLCSKLLGAFFDPLSVGGHHEVGEATIL